MFKKQFIPIYLKPTSNTTSSNYFHGLFLLKRGILYSQVLQIKEFLSPLMIIWQHINLLFYDKIKKSMVDLKDCSFYVKWVRIWSEFSLLLIETSLMEERKNSSVAIRAQTWFNLSKNHSWAENEINCYPLEIFHNMEHELIMIIC